MLKSTLKTSNQLKTATRLLKEEDMILAPYAMKSSASAGRVHPEPEDPFRLPFQRDRDRIIHCRSFRRLQAKTQVLVSYYGDHYRDRLTHSMEVSQIARDICRNLGLNEDLAECISLAHDLGHPPFGHGGEQALDEAMKEHGLHFEHNEQSHRIIEKLEKIYPGFDGLNPSKEVLDGLLKHNPHKYLTYTKFVTSPHLEAQVMDLSDEIAYINHDVDDGIRAEIITLSAISGFALWKDAEKVVREKYGKLEPSKDADRKRIYVSRVVSKMISLMIGDLLETTEKNLKKHKIDSLAKVRAHKGMLVSFSAPMKIKQEELRAFLMRKFYLNPKVEKRISHGKSIIKKLFRHYRLHPALMPVQFYNQIIGGERPEIVIKDYIAGMTDPFAEIAAKAIKN
jgi:dGTPase